MTQEQQVAVLEAVGCLNAFKSMLLKACDEATKNDADASTPEAADRWFRQTLRIVNDAYAEAVKGTSDLGEAVRRAGPLSSKLN